MSEAAPSRRLNILETEDIIINFGGLTAVNNVKLRDRKSVV